MLLVLLVLRLPAAATHDVPPPPGMRRRHLVQPPPLSSPTPPARCPRARRPLLAVPVLADLLCVFVLQANGGKGKQLRRQRREAGEHMRGAWVGSGRRSGAKSSHM